MKKTILSILTAAAMIAGLIAGPGKTAVSASEAADSGTLNGVSFVLIYNPDIFDENDAARQVDSSRSTGDLASQIITGLNRADGLEKEMPAMISQAEINSGISLKQGDRANAKAGGMDPLYTVGDQADFYCCSQSLNTRTLETFDCVYEGEHCYIWSLNGSVSDTEAADLGTEFDNVIYEKDVAAFGPARFTENGGKVNMLFYPMEQSLGGFFTIYDIFAGTEVSELDKVTYGLNTDHAIININSTAVASTPDLVKSTLAHEFQHQICASDCFYYSDTPMMRTWLNEAMSAYAEDLVYPGIKDQYYYNQAMYLSDLFRKGQSLYNFNTTGDSSIGAYGAVYLFSQYMKEHAGDDIFLKVHDYWRTSMRADVSEAGALLSSVPDSFRDEISGKYSYPENIAPYFKSEEEEFLSKLALDFTLESISPELAKLTEYKDQMHAAMLYTEVNPQEIEGGGRMLVATQGDTFTIPSDSEKVMLYVGLDSDFNVVTDWIAG